MKKTLKHSLACLIALAMLVVMAIPAFAAGHGSITINNAVAEHTYTAYKILAGDTFDGKLSNVSWGDGVTDAGKTALYTKYGLTGDNQTAEKVAEAIAASTTNTAATADDSKAIEFANTVGTNVQNGKSGDFTATTTYKITDLDDGYYMIVDNFADAKQTSRYMVQLVGEATVNNKIDKPTVDKAIVTGTNTKSDYNTAQIGDKVDYVLTATTPQYDGYKEYYIDFNDTLSKGLTYDANTGITVKVNGTAIDANNYVVTIGYYDATNGTAIKVHLKDMVSRSTTFPVGSTIEVSYSALVNDNAVIGKAGNTNTAKLAYSNDPLNSGDGTPDNAGEEGGNDGLINGESADSKTYTFVTELDLTKVIADTTTPLEGAVFNVKGNTINKVLITGTHFVEDTNGTYYALNDGTYTTNAPTTATASQYKDSTGATKYAKVAYGDSSVQETANVDFQVISESEGKVKVTGLKEGTYTIEEIQAPDGYNKLANLITIVVTSNVATITDAEQFAWTITVDGKEVSNTGTAAYNIENKAGTTLPSTGGIGTYIVVIAGLAIVAAGVILMTKRSKKEEE